MELLPSKLILGNLVNSVDTEYWYDSVPSSWDGYAYRWKVTCNVEPQSHSSDKTRFPYFYDGEDVAVGDWIADANSAVKIIEIISKTSSQIEVIVEDIERFNTLNDPFQSGFGGLGYGSIFVFSLNESGVPLLRGLPVGRFLETTASAIQSRFAERNPTDTFVTVKQTNHGFSIGDFIKVDEDNEGRFELVAAADVNFAIGIVTSIGISGTDSFTYKPLGELLENVTPGLIGAYGDIFYIDTTAPGKVTNTRPFKNAKPVYVRLDAPNRAFLLNVSVDEDTNNKSFKFENVVLDQTEFTMPADAIDVQLMSINGIENKDFTFDPVSKVLTFDPVATGYGVDETDEVIFVYLS